MKYNFCHATKEVNNDTTSKMHAVNNGTCHNNIIITRINNNNWNKNMIPSSGFQVPGGNQVTVQVVKDA